jgi:hypothetical protein
MTWADPGRDVSLPRDIALKAMHAADALRAKRKKPVNNSSKPCRWMERQTCPSDSAVVSPSSRACPGARAAATLLLAASSIWLTQPDPAPSHVKVSSMQRLYVLRFIYALRA